MTARLVPVPGPLLGHVLAGPTVVWVAALSVAAALFLVRPPARDGVLAGGRTIAGGPSVASSSPRSGRVRWIRATVVALLLVVLAAEGGLVGPRAVAHVGAAVVVVAGVSSLLAQGRRRRDAQLLAEQVLEACSSLADELRAGRSPERALELAARDCAELAPAVRAARLGADVPAALRRGRHPDLRLLAGAWHVAHRSGDGLATALVRVGEGLAAAGVTRRVVASELASARSTARLLVALPGLALAAGAGGGGRPWEFLLHTTPGTVCLIGGLGLGLTGLWWIESIAADVEQEL